MPQFTTRVAVDEPARKELVTMLNTCLATTIDLYTQVKQAHWNIKGAHFVSRHELFDSVAGHALEWADELAERASTLGGYATGTVRDAAERSKLAVYDASAVDGLAHLREVAERLASYCKMIRECTKLAGRLEEPVTEDLCIGVLRRAELDLWFIESHLNN